MMNATQQAPKLLTIARLFEQDEYIIPIYQRNYAWGKAEVEQLLQDIADMAEQGGSTSYFLGTLVVHQRSEHCFETIDGQQRHTTLSIILAAIKQVLTASSSAIPPALAALQPNLTFESRPRSRTSLEALASSHIDPQRIEEPAMKTAFSTAKDFLSKMGEKQAGFISYLLNNVKILRVTVPPDTDLNHYFEIMNNRGEQLEKHEVLKARLMGIKGTDDSAGLTAQEQHGFARLWDACAEMDRYLVMNFTKEERLKLFGKNLETLPDGFDSLSQQLGTANEDKTSKTLGELLKNPTFAEPHATDDQEFSGAFTGVINFPNFLLQVLRIHTGAPTSLDDKKLLPTFETEIKTAQQVKAFAHTLLTCRQLLDRYIIKRKNDEKWTLKSIKPYEEKAFGDVNSFASETQNQQLTMLLSMFHVSYPAQPRKHWLSAALGYLYKHANGGTVSDGQSYLNYLETLSDRFFFGRFYTAEPLEYDALLSLDITAVTQQAVPDTLNDKHLHRGTHTHHFIFNRLDYLIWKRRVILKETVPCGEDDSLLEAQVAGFHFTQSKSVEHHYPQHPVDGIPFGTPAGLPEGVDSFGNLCLISQSQNARLNNLLPAGKKDFYSGGKRADSLKHLVMMSHQHWGPDHADVIKQHEDDMINILCSVEDTVPKQAER